MTDADPSESSALPKLIALHLVPGALVAAFYVMAAPLVAQRGLPAGVTLLLGFLLVGIPIELGYLLRLGKRRNGRSSLQGIVLNRERIPAWQYPVFFLAFLSFAFGALALLSPVTEVLAGRVFGWLPWFLRPDGVSPFAPPHRGWVLAGLVLGLVVDGLINPVVEELYFRGFLLPRLGQRLGAWAPLVGALLFTLQHFWQPYNYPLLIVLQIPLVYAVWWKRNIYLGILVHCGGNLLGAALSLVSFFSTG